MGDGEGVCLRTVSVIHVHVRDKGKKQSGPGKECVYIYVLPFLKSSQNLLGDRLNLSDKSYSGQ